MKETSIIIQKRNGSKVDYAKEWSQGSGKSCFSCYASFQYCLAFFPPILLHIIALIEFLWFIFFHIGFLEVIDPLVFFSGCPNILTH